jgi:hypothetical protein
MSCSYHYLWILYFEDSQEEVETLVKLAHECNVAIIPYGGLLKFFLLEFLLNSILFQAKMLILGRMLVEF